MVLSVVLAASFRKSSRQKTLYGANLATVSKFKNVEEVNRIITISCSSAKSFFQGNELKFYTTESSF